MQVLALLGVGVWTLIVVAVVAVGVYLFLRNNPNKKNAIDKAVDEVKKKL